MTNKIVIVDDDVNLSRVWEKWLTEAGYPVVVVNKPKEVHDTIDKEKPSLILLDVLMPGTDGIQLALEIKNNDFTGSLTIIMMSAIYKHNDIKLHARDSVSDFLSKPFSKEALISTVGKYLPLPKQGDGKSESTFDIDAEIPGDDELFANLFAPKKTAPPPIQNDAPDGFEIETTSVDKPNPPQKAPRFNHDETVVSSIPEMQRKAARVEPEPEENEITDVSIDLSGKRYVDDMPEPEPPVFNIDLPDDPGPKPKTRTAKKSVDQELDDLIKKVKKK